MPEDPVRAGEGTDESIVVPVTEEEVVTGARPVTTGGVRVEKQVESRIRKLDIPLVHEEVEVKRVPVNRVVAEAPSPHKEGDVLIIPVVEEELIVTKRLVVKEEIHILKKRFQDRVVKEVELEREHAVVQRIDEQGRVVRTASEPVQSPPQPQPRRARSIVEKAFNPDR